MIENFRLFYFDICCGERVLIIFRFRKCLVQMALALTAGIFFLLVDAIFFGDRFFIQLIQQQECRLLHRRQQKEEREKYGAQNFHLVKLHQYTTKCTFSRMISVIK